MKKLALTVCMVFILFAGNAHALWTDVYNPTDVFFNSDNLFYTFTHDIRDNGFDVGLETVTGFTLTMNFYDDRDWLPESFMVDIIGDLSLPTWLFQASLFNAEINGDATLNESGMLTVNIYRVVGDFYFAQSTLTAEGKDVAVPEPTTMLLLGLGLVGIAAVRRRK